MGPKNGRKARGAIVYHSGSDTNDHRNSQSDDSSSDNMDVSQEYFNARAKKILLTKRKLAKKARLGANVEK